MSQTHAQKEVYSCVVCHEQGLLITPQIASGQDVIVFFLFVYLFSVYIPSGDGCLPRASSSWGVKITLNNRLAPHQTDGSSSGDAADFYNHSNEGTVGRTGIVRHL